jgi:hypothetical protein
LALPTASESAVRKVAVRQNILRFVCGAQNKGLGAEVSSEAPSVRVMAITAGNCRMHKHYVVGVELDANATVFQACLVHLIERVVPGHRADDTNDSLPRSQTHL